MPQVISFPKRSNISGIPAIPPLRRLDTPKRKTRHKNWGTGRHFHDLEVGDEIVVDEEEYPRTACARAYFQKWYKREHNKTMVIKSRVLRGHNGAVCGYLFWRVV